MSDEKKEAVPIDMLSALTEDQLQEIFTMELMSDETDISMIKRVNAVLKAKTPQQGEFDVDAKWQEFVSDYVGTQPLCDVNDEPDNNRTSKPTAHRVFRPSLGAAVAIAAVIVLLSGTVTAYALGYDVFGAIATWTKETFSFTQQTEMTPSAAVPSEDMTGISDLQSALDEYGITEKLAPTYIPDGYMKSEFYVDTSNTCTLFTSVLDNGDDTIIIQIRQYSSAKDRADYEKDIEDPEVYTIGDIPHYIMANMGECLAIWAYGLYEVNISGLKTEDELIKMIDSIYER